MMGGAFVRFLFCWATIGKDAVFTHALLVFSPKRGKWCGAGGIRTHVQTGKPYAFYTLIPAFGFRALARPGPPTNALSPKISFDERGHAKLFPIYLHRLISWLRNNSL